MPYQFDNLLNAKSNTDVDCLSDLVHWNGVNILSSGQRRDKSVFGVKARRHCKRRATNASNKAKRFSMSIFYEKCIDFKCVQKPTNSRLGVIHHANKSSR